MKTLIEQYNHERDIHTRAKRYFDVFDKPGHMQEKGFVHAAKVTLFTVYHQAYPGANNYHDAEQWLLDEISSVICDLGPSIREKVMKRLEVRMAAAAHKARAEAEEVIKATEPRQ